MKTVETEVQLRNELISRISDLEGKQETIESNRETLTATVEALSECTSVDLTTIQSIADRLSVLPKFVNSNNKPTQQQLQLARNLKLAKYVSIFFVVLFSFSIFKFLHINSNMKSVLHDVSPIQSRISDFNLRTGRYPHEFSSIGYADSPPKLDSVEKIEMGPNGQLLIKISGVTGNEILLRPIALNGGYTSKWQCSTNSSWVFKINSWLCQYQPYLRFNHL